MIKQQLTKEKLDCIRVIDQLKSEINSLKSELADTKEILEQRNEEKCNLNNNLEVSQSATLITSYCSL